MTPLSPYNTQRYLVHQVTNGGSHTTLFRANSASTPATVIAAINSFLTQLKGSMLTTWSAVGLDYAPAFNPVTTPQTFTAIVGTNSTGATDHTKDPIFITFLGRTSGGRRARLSFFGSAFVPDQNYRIDPGQAANLTTCIGILNGDTSGLSAIDGSKPLWKLYVDAGFNAYQQRRARRVNAP
jgi:hypothetical protein